MFGLLTWPFFFVLFFVVDDSTVMYFLVGEVKQERRVIGVGPEMKDGSGPSVAGIKRQGSEGKLPDPKKKRT